MTLQNVKNVENFIKNVIKRSPSDNANNVISAYCASSFLYYNFIMLRCQSVVNSVQNDAKYH